MGHLYHGYVSHNQRVLCMSFTIHHGLVHVKVEHPQNFTDAALRPADFPN